jgi:hypothetical protein
MLSISPAVIGISYGCKNDGDCFGSILGGQGSRRPGRDEHVDFETDQLISRGGEPVELIISGSKLEGYVLALNIAKFTELSQQ